MKKIKVCHIITKLELGGAQRNTLYTVSHLNKDKFETVLIAGKGGILDQEAQALEGTRSYFVSTLIRQINPVMDLLALISLWKILSKEKPDIVHTHSSKAGILGRWAAKFAGVKTIIHTYHGFGFHDFQNTLIHGIYVFLERLTSPITDKIIVVANTDKVKGLKENIGEPDKYLLIRSGIETKNIAARAARNPEKKKKLGFSESTKIITTVGPFKPQKNLQDFIKLCAIVKQSITDCAYLIIGDGSERPGLEALARNLGVSDSLKFLGWRKDVSELLGITDVFVMTSLWEGLPRAILEAMCAGVPVVANAVDGVNDIISDNITGFLAKPRDVGRAAELVIKLLKDEQTAKSIGEKAKASISREFDIDEMVRKQEELYLDFVGKLN